MTNKNSLYLFLLRQMLAYGKSKSLNENNWQSPDRIAVKPAYILEAVTHFAGKHLLVFIPQNFIHSTRALAPRYIMLEQLSCGFWLLMKVHARHHAHFMRQLPGFIIGNGMVMNRYCIKQLLSKLGIYLH